MVMRTNIEEQRRPSIKRIMTQMLIQEKNNMPVICFPFILFSIIYIIVNQGYLFKMHIPRSHCQPTKWDFLELVLNFLISSSSNFMRIFDLLIFLWISSLITIELKIFEISICWEKYTSFTDAISPWKMWLDFKLIHTPLSSNIVTFLLKQVLWVLLRGHMPPGQHSVCTQGAVVGRDLLSLL